MMTSSSPLRAPTRAISISVPKPPPPPPIIRGDRAHGSKSSMPHLQRSISEVPTSSPLISPRTMNRAKSSLGEQALSPRSEQESGRRRASRAPPLVESLSDHFRSDGNKLPSIDLHSSYHSSSRSVSTSSSKTKTGTPKRSPRLRSSQDDSIVVRRRARDRSVNSDGPMRPKSLLSLTKSDANATSAVSPQITIEDESTQSQRSVSSRRSARDDAENEGQKFRSKSKANTSSRNRLRRRSGRSDTTASVSNIDVVSSSASLAMDGDGSVVSNRSNRLRRRSSRTDVNMPCSNIDAVSSSASLAMDGDGSVVSNSSRRRRMKTALPSPVEPLAGQLESLMSEDRRRNRDSSSVASETIPRDPRRELQRNGSSETDELAEFAEFERALKTEDSATRRRTPHVSNMPISRPKRGSERSLAGAQKRSIRKQTRIRMVKSDDEGIADVLEKKASMRNLRACLTDEEDEFEDGLDDSLKLTDILTGGPGKRSGKDARRRSARHYSTGQASVFSDEENGVDHHQVDPSAHDRMGMSMPAMSLKVMELGALVQQQKAQKKFSKTLSPSKNGADNVEDKEEDIFTFYSWSTSRQPRSKILEERKKLRDSVREGPLLASYEALMRMG